MKEYYYMGLDVHKKTVSYCVKAADGAVRDEGTLAATRATLREWADGLNYMWVGGWKRRCSPGGFTMCWTRMRSS